MRKQLFIFLFAISVLAYACTRNENNSVPQNQQQLGPEKYNATAQCTTYKSDGSVLQVGTPFSYVLTKEPSTKTGFNLHFINLTGDADTSVHAIKSTTAENFTISWQDFRTSSGANLYIIGAGLQPADSINFTWSFFQHPSYKSHECNCKSKKQ